MSKEAVPFADMAALHAPLQKQIAAAMEEVVRSGSYILGPAVEKFEAEFAKYVGVKYAIGVNSGTDALFIALRAAGVNSGDEVICPSWSFFATAEAISQIGAIPVFCDISPDTFNIDPAKIGELVSPKTRALVVVHLYGLCADMKAIQAVASKHNLIVVEDNAQATGARRDGIQTGAHSIGCFSFFPTKCLGAIGDGGMITFHDEKMAKVARMLRAHGGVQKYTNELLGYNSRLDAIQAAILSVKLPHLDEHNALRVKIAQGYKDRLGDIKALKLPDVPKDGSHVFHQYTLRVVDGDREAIRNKMQDDGIPTMVYYPNPIHRQPIYAGANAAPSRAGVLTHTDMAAKQAMSLPIWPLMPAAHLDLVAASLRRAVGA